MKGKLCTYLGSSSKMPMENQRILSLAYSEICYVSSRILSKLETLTSLQKTPLFFSSPPEKLFPLGFLPELPSSSNHPLKNISPALKSTPGSSASTRPPLSLIRSSSNRKRHLSLAAGMLPNNGLQILSISSYSCCFPIRPSTPLSWFHSHQPGGSTWLSRSPPAGQWAAQNERKKRALNGGLHLNFKIINLEILYFSQKKSKKNGQVVELLHQQLKFL